MDPQEIYKLIQPIVDNKVRQIIDSELQQDKYSPSNTQAHSHNGSDSLQLAYDLLTNKYFAVTWSLPGTSPATAGNYGVFFTAHTPCIVQGATEVHQTKGTDGSAVSVQIERLTGITAAGSGTALLNTAFNLKGADNTVQTGSIVSSTNPNVQQATTFLALNDRLALKLIGTPTAIVGLTVVIKLLIWP